MARKPRGDSKLDNLPEAQREELVQGIMTGWSYEAARQFVMESCGVSVSLSAFTPFYSRHVAPVLKERKQFAALSARTLAKLAKETEAFDAAAIGELKEFAYRLIRDPNSQPEEARRWMETLIKAQAGARDSRKLAMLEAKAAQADEAAGVANDKKLTPEEKAAELKRIFRMG
jgi:hypothetical protein